jgi:hypothetical protein
MGWKHIDWHDVGKPGSKARTCDQVLDVKRLMASKSCCATGNCSALKTALCGDIANYFDLSLRIVVTPNRLCVRLPRSGRSTLFPCGVRDLRIAGQPRPAVR